MILTSSLTFLASCLPFHILRASNKFVAQSWQRFGHRPTTNPAASSGVQEQQKHSIDLRETLQESTGIPLNQFCEAYRSVGSFIIPAIWECSSGTNQNGDFHDVTFVAGDDSDDSRGLWGTTPEAIGERRNWPWWRRCPPRPSVSRCLCSAPQES